MIEYHSVRQTAFQVFCQTRSIAVHPYFPRRVSKKARCTLQRRSGATGTPGRTGGTGIFKQVIKEQNHPPYGRSEQTQEAKNTFNNFHFSRIAKVNVLLTEQPFVRIIPFHKG